MFAVDRVAVLGAVARHVRSPPPSRTAVAIVGDASAWPSGPSADWSTDAPVEPEDQS